MNLITTFPFLAAAVLLIWTLGLILFPKKRPLGSSLLALGTLALAARAKADA